MKNQHHPWVIPEDKDAPLWRYMALDKFEDLISRSALYFARMDQLGDDHEGAYSAPTIAARPQFFEGATEHFLAEGLQEMNRTFALYMHASCWHNNDHESVAMWNLYATEDKGIAIKTTMHRLKNSIRDEEHEFWMWAVNYIDYDTVHISDGHAVAPYFYKRQEFEHEREFRAITENLDQFDGSGETDPPKGVHVPVDLFLLIETVVVSPYAVPDVEARVHELLDGTYLEHKLRPSRLLRPPLR